MGTNIAQGEGFALVGAAKQDRLVEQGLGHHLARLQLVAGHGMVPDVAQQVDVVNSNHRVSGRLRVEAINTVAEAWQRSWVSIANFYRPSLVPDR